MVSPRTLADLYDTRSREEGFICELKYPPKFKSVHGYIEVPSIGEKLFFKESLSGIQKAEIVNYHLNANVQFSVDRNTRGFFAKNLYIKVFIMLYCCRVEKGIFTHKQSNNNNSKAAD